MCSVSQSAYLQSREGEGGVLHFLTLNGLMDIKSLFKAFSLYGVSIHPSTEDFWLLVENLYTCAIGPFKVLNGLLRTRGDFRGKYL